ncbi:hypothetical protein ACR79B_20620 [Sphingobacterium spiritivorum]|uniref:hypothetical protein n=1 Tax=Sphingobacterium spiritivorum TaxID=258 RepID=UPI003DA3A338
MNNKDREINDQRLRSYYQTIDKYDRLLQDHRRIVIIGSKEGLGLSGCQKIQLFLSGIIVLSSIDDINNGLSKLVQSSNVTKESFIDLRHVLNPLAIQTHKISKEKKPKYIRQQHKLAVKFSNRK